MPEGVAAVFARLAELADADGRVPEDGSGVDGVWTTTIPARDRDDDWQVAVNADTHQQHDAIEFPVDGDVTTIPAGRAVVYLRRTPAGVVGPRGGGLTVDRYESGTESIEDELLGDLEAHLKEVDS